MGSKNNIQRVCSLGGNLIFKTPTGTEYFRVDQTNGRIHTKNADNKMHNRPTTDAYVLEVKSEFTSATAAHYAVPITVDYKPTGGTGTTGSIQGLQGVSRLAATYTMTGGSIIGTYGQACNLGTLNGSGIMVAGLYGLIEDGGTYTAVSHVASLWVDSHLAQTVTAGSSELIYATNNGATTLNSVMYVYAGNKITNLFTISTATGMVGDNTVADATFANWKPIKIDLDGTTHYLIAAQTIS